MWLIARAYTLPFVNWWPPSFSVTRVFHAGLLHEAKKLANFPALKPQILPGSLQTDSGRGISFRYLIYKSCHSVVQKIFNLVCSDKHTYLLTYLCFQFQSWLYNAIVGLKSTILLQISYERLLSRIVAIIHKSYIDV